MIYLCIHPLTFLLLKTKLSLILISAPERSPICQHLKETDPEVPVNATTRELIGYFGKRVGRITHAKGIDLAAWEDGLQNADREELTVPFDRTSYPNDNVYAYQWYNIWENLVGGGTYRFANADYKVCLTNKIGLIMTTNFIFRILSFRLIIFIL